MNHEHAVAVLAGLAHSSRLAIFRLLVASGPNGLPAGQIAQELDISPATLSFHLKELTHVGLTRSRQEGRFVFYAANFDETNALLGYLTENCCEGAPCEVNANACTLPESSQRAGTKRRKTTQ